MRVVCFGAHPDDIEIAMGGTLSKLYNEGHELFMVIGCIPDNVDRRIKEATNSARYIGSTLLFLEEGMGCQLENLYQYKIVNFCDKVIKNIKPDLVFTHCYCDPHYDHRLFNNAVFASMRNSHANLLNFFSPVKKGIYNISKTNYLYDISQYVESKMKLISFHASQLTGNNKQRWINETLSFNQYLGSMYGVEYAEAFECVKMLV